MDVGTVVGRIVANTGQFDVSIASSTAKLNAFSAKFQASMAKNSAAAGVLGKAVFGLSVAIGALAIVAVARMGKFDQAMKQSTAVSVVTAEQYVEMAKKAEEASINLNMAADKVARGFYFLGSAGLSATEQIAAFTPVAVMAKAGVMEMGAAAEIVVDTMKGFKISFEKTAAVTDVLTKGFTSSNTTLLQMGEALSYVAGIANTTNNTLIDTVAVLGLFANVGVKGSMAGTSLRMALLGLAAPTSEAKDVIEKYTNAYDKATGKMRPFVEILRDLIPALQKVSEEERNMALKTIFGVRALAGMTELFQLGPEKINAFVESLKNAGGETQRIADIQLSAFNEQLGISFKIMDDMMRKIGKNIIDEIFGDLGAFNVKLKTMNEQLDGIDKKTKQTIKGIKDFLTTVAFIAETIWNTLLVLTTAGTGVFVTIKNGLIAIGATAMDVGLIIAESLSAAFTLAYSSAAQYFTRLDELFDAFFLLDFSRMKEIISEPFESISDIAKTKFAQIEAHAKIAATNAGLKFEKVADSAKQTMAAMAALWATFTKQQLVFTPPETPAVVSPVVDVTGAPGVPGAIPEKKKWDPGDMQGMLARGFGEEEPSGIFQRINKDVDQIGKKLEELGKKTQGTFEQIFRGLGQIIKETLAVQLAAVFEGGKFKAKEFFKYLKTMLIQKSIMALLNLIIPGTGTGTSLIGGAFGMETGGRISNFGLVPQIQIPAFASGVSGYQIPSSVPMDTMPVLVGGGEEIDVRSKSQVGDRDKLLRNINSTLKTLISVVYETQTTLDGEMIKNSYDRSVRRNNAFQG